MAVDSHSHIVWERESMWTLSCGRKDTEFNLEASESLLKKGMQFFWPEEPLPEDHSAFREVSPMTAQRIHLLMRLNRNMIGSTYFKGTNSALKTNFILQSPSNLGNYWSKLCTSDKQEGALVSAHKEKPGKENQCSLQGSCVTAVLLGSWNVVHERTNLFFFNER